MAFPTKTGSGGSGSKKLAAFKKRAAARAKPGESPSQYRQKVERERASTPTPTQKTTIAEQLMPGVKSPHLLEKFIRQNKPPTPVQVTDLFPGITKKDLIGDFVASKNKDVPPKLSQAEINKIRAVHNKLPNFAGLPMSANILAALRTDLQFREMRIYTREQNIDKLNDQANLELTRLNSYNKYIKNGAFVGTESQYKAYQNQFKKYENAANRYNRTIQAHNIDVKEYNKNLQNVKSKTRPAAPIAKVLSRFKQAKLYAQSKMKKPEIVQNYLQNTLANSYKVMGQSITIPKNSQQYKDWEKVMKGGLTQAQLDNRAVFYGNMYRSVYDKPLKSVGTAALFFVGGPLLKGFSTGMRALAAAAKAGNKKALVLASLGKAIEGGAIGLYTGQTGKRFVEADSVAQYGYITGDVLFNEILPAGIGARYGIRVVSKLPKGAKLLKGTGTKIIKESAKVSRLTKEAYVSRKKAWTTRRQVKADGKRLKETVARLRAEKKQVPQWMKDELKVIRASERIETPESFKRFLADTKGEVSPRVKTKRKAAQQKLITETKTKVKEAKKTEDQLISEFEAQQRAFMAQETKLKQTGAVQKTALEKIQARRQKLRTRQRTNTIQARLQKHRQALKLKEKQAAIEQSKLKKIKSQLVINNAKLAKIAMSAQTLSQIKKLMGEQRTLLTQLPKQQQRYKQAIKNIQKQRTIVLNDMKAINKIITDAKRVASTKTKAKPVTKIKTKPPKPLEIPKIPDMHPEKKTRKIIRRRKVTRSLDTRQFNNAVADISTIFG